jgi:AcrR family transcriptional regulator
MFKTNVSNSCLKQVFKEIVMNGSDTQNATNLTKKEAMEARQRLIDAAEELFAHKGFDGTSIRDITTKANCNLASINYHFGDKQELYEELFRQRLREMREARLESIKTAMAGGKKATLENLLHNYSVAFLEPFADRKRSQRFMQLFARELVEQRLPKNMFLEEMAVPVMNALEEALRAVCPNLDKLTAQMCIHSVVGQLIHVAHINAMFEGEQGRVLAPFDTASAIDHIVKFSAAGIKTLVRDSNK